MKYDIIDTKKDDGIDPLTGLAKHSRGGTERMFEGLVTRVDVSDFQITCSRFRELDPSKKHRILWCHDTFDDPESKRLSDMSFRKQFDKIVFVSNYQFQTYHLAHGVTYAESDVMPNAIEPIELVEKDKDEIRLIYHTTPHRGLQILVPVFDALCKKYPNITLDIYSSFGIYGWDEKDKPYEELFKQCRDHPRINYHGWKPNKEIRKALQKSHIFAFPSIWPETSCIAAIEAMSAGNIVVCPDYAALSETVGNYGFQYRWNENIQEHANTFYAALASAIESINEDFMQRKMKTASSYANSMYDWNLRANRWEYLLNSIRRNK